MTGWHYSKAKIVIVGHSVKKRRVRKQLRIEHRFGRDKDCNRDRDYRQRLAKSTHEHHHHGLAIKTVKKVKLSSFTLMLLLSVFPYQ